jgi:hypothetical protein
LERNGEIHSWLQTAYDAGIISPSLLMSEEIFFEISKNFEEIPRLEDLFLSSAKWIYKQPNQVAKLFASTEIVKIMKALEECNAYPFVHRNNVDVIGWLIERPGQMHVKLLQSIPTLNKNGGYGVYTPFVGTDAIIYVLGGKQDLWPPNWRGAEQKPKGVPSGGHEKYDPEMYELEFSAMMELSLKIATYDNNPNA